MNIKRMFKKTTGIIAVSSILVATMGAGEALAKKNNRPVRAITASTLTIDFGTVGVGTTSDPVVVTFTSTGNANVTLAADAALRDVLGSEPGEYLLSPGTCTGGSVLAPGATCTVSVQFAPTHGDLPSWAAVELRSDAPTRGFIMEGLGI